MKQHFKLGCDKCDDLDGDYWITVFKDGHQLKWDNKIKKFVCPRNHKESFEQATRHLTEESLFKFYRNYLFKKIKREK